MTKLFYKKLSRRAFFAWMVGSAFPGLCFGRLTFKNSINPDDIVLQRLASSLVNASFSRPVKAMHLGSVYMRTFPQESNILQLLHILAETPPGLVNKAINGNLSSLRIALQQQIKDDFKLGKVVNIDGWVVAQTEARLSALTNFV